MQASNEVVIASDTAYLPGFLQLPEDREATRGVVIFAHGSGSSRFSKRNREVAEALNRHGYATLLFDLLSMEENVEDRYTRKHRFNIPLLAARLVAAVDYTAGDEFLQHLPVGLFGASTGAAAAIIAAAERPRAVCAVVSRGGRPDLAGDALAKARVPIMLVVGERDSEVIDLNRRAASRLQVMHRSVLVTGATHLFEEPGALEKVTELAIDWFDDWLVKCEPPPGRNQEWRPQA